MKAFYTMSMMIRTKPLTGRTVARISLYSARAQRLSIAGEHLGLQDHWYKWTEQMEYELRKREARETDENLRDGKESDPEMDLWGSGLWKIGSSCISRVPCPPCRL